MEQVRIFTRVPCIDDINHRLLATTGFYTYYGQLLEMGDENFNFESFINFMKFIKLSRGTFESFIEILK